MNRRLLNVMLSMLLSIAVGHETFAQTQPNLPRPSDAELTERIRETLMKDARLSKITKDGLNIQTSNGVATLRGNVSGPIEATRIIQTVRQITGRDAVNGMTSLMRQNDASSSDIDIE